MSIEDKQDKILSLADEIGLTDTLAVLREWKMWDELIEAVADDVVTANLAASMSSFDGMRADLAKAEDALGDIQSAATRLHEAICEGRRQDAVDILNEVTDLNFRTVAAQMNLFPDRITL